MQTYNCVYSKGFIRKIIELYYISNSFQHLNILYHSPLNSTIYSANVLKICAVHTGSLVEGEFK